MNKVILMGRLTKDPEVRYTNGRNGDQMAIAKYSLAVDRKNKDAEKNADFFTCTSFGKQAEVVQKYLTKGSKVLVMGRLQNDDYTNRDGAKVYTVQVLVEEMEFAESKKDGSTPQPQVDAPVPQKQDEFIDIPDEAINDLPFK